MPRTTKTAVTEKADRGSLLASVVLKLIHLPSADLALVAEMIDRMAAVPIRKGGVR